MTKFVKPQFSVACSNLTASSTGSGEPETPPPAPPRRGEGSQTQRQYAMRRALMAYNGRKGNHALAPVDASMADGEWRMKENGWRTAARYGMPFGVGLALPGGVIALAAIVDPSLPRLVLLILWLVIGALCAFLAAQFAARATGSFEIGTKASAISWAVPLMIFAIFVYIPIFQEQQAHPNQQALPGAVRAVLAIAILLFCGAVLGGLVGSVIGVPGAWLGEHQARQEHAFTLSSREHVNAPEASPGALDDPSLLTAAALGDITIDASWPKAALIFAITLGFGALFVFMAWDDLSVVIRWIGLAFFVLVIPLGPLQLLINRPLLRFSEEGIAYKGAYPFWRRGFVPWHEVGAMVMASSSNKLFGRKELNLFIDGVQPWRATFQNWQLPVSTRKRLLVATIRYRKQIEENEIVVRGIE